MDRKVYIDKMAAKLKEWDDDILELEHKAGEIKDEASNKYHEQLKDLKSRREHARQELEHLRDSGGEAWEELKEGMEKSWDTLEDSLKKAWAILKQ